VWLAEQGWEVTGVDFSAVGLAKAQRFAALWNVEATWVESAVQEWRPPSEGFDLVAVLYLQLPQPERSIALEVAASAVAPGHVPGCGSRPGELDQGFGGPPNAEVLYKRCRCHEVAVGAGLTVERAEQVVRVVDTDTGTKDAIDTLVRAKRPM